MGKLTVGAEVAPPIVEKVGTLTHRDPFIPPCLRLQYLRLQHKLTPNHLNPRLPIGGSQSKREPLLVTRVLAAAEGRPHVVDVARLLWQALSREISVDEFTLTAAEEGALRATGAHHIPCCTPLQVRQVRDRTPRHLHRRTVLRSKDEQRVGCIHIRIISIDKIVIISSSHMSVHTIERRRPYPRVWHVLMLPFRHFFSFIFFCWIC